LPDSGLPLPLAVRHLHRRAGTLRSSTAILSTEGCQMGEVFGTSGSLGFECFHYRRTPRPSVGTNCLQVLQVLSSTNIGQLIALPYKGSQNALLFFGSQQRFFSGPFFWPCVLLGRGEGKFIKLENTTASRHVERLTETRAL